MEWKKFIGKVNMIEDKFQDVPIRFLRTIHLSIKHSQITPRSISKHVLKRINDLREIYVTGNVGSNLI